MLKTSIELVMDFKDHGKITIPKGTSVTHQTALGNDPEYNFINDFSWMVYPDGKKKHSLIHDAKYYGIDVPESCVEDV